MPVEEKSLAASARRAAEIMSKLRCVLLIAKLSAVTTAVRPSQVNRTALAEHGFVVVPNVFSQNFVARVHQQIVQHLPLGWRQEGGVALVGAYDRPEFDFFRDLIDGKQIRSIADAVFADAPEGYRACGPHGMGVNRVVGWHKDRLNNRYRRHEKTPLWGPGSEVQGGHRACTQDSNPRSLDAHTRPPSLKAYAFEYHCCRRHLQVWPVP